MTSNIGSELILHTKELTDEVKHQIDELLHKHFRPEFLNRIDSIVYFRMLTEADVQKIAKLQLHELEKRLKEQNITLTIDDKVIKELAQRGYEKEFGARPLKRAIQRYVTVPISQYLLQNPDTKKIHVKLKNDTFVIE